MAATSERRKSFSQFFGFSKPEVKQEAAPAYPKLRHKLQKVSKQTSADVDFPPIGHVAAPAPDSIETVQVPGDNSFLSTKYESRPVSSYGGANKAATAAEAKPSKEERRSRRESRTRFFSRSSSTSRGPPVSRSTSCNRASFSASRPATAAATAEPVPPVPSGPLAKASTATVSAPAPAPAPAPVSSSSDAKTDHEREYKAAQTARQTRALSILEAHEREAAQKWTGLNRSSLCLGPSEPTKAPRQQQEVTPPPSRHQSQPEEWPLARPFHLPYNAVIATQKANDAAEARYFANRSPYPSRPFTPAPITIPGKQAAHTPGHAHSNSNVSSLTASTPMSATFSACLSFTSVSSVNHSGPDESSCPGTPNDAKLSPYGFSRAHSRQQSQDSHAAPELSYLSRSRSRHMTESSTSITSDECSPMPRRKKTPVYAIGQLEGNSSSDDSSILESSNAYAPAKEPITINVQRAPDSSESTKSRAELDLLKSMSSIECIAEEYRALLASRCSNRTEEQAEVKSEAAATQRSTSGVPRNDNSAQAVRQTPPQRRFLLSPGPERQGPPMAHIDSYCDRQGMPSATPASPTTAKMTTPLPLRTRSSMHGTSPASKANASANNKAAAKPKEVPQQQQQQQQPDNLSLQICVDLLARELSSAVTHRSSAAAATAASQRAAARRSLQHNMTGGMRDPQTLTWPKATPSMAPPATNSPDSALQILVMIEAYERLRDQLVADARRKRQQSLLNRGRGDVGANVEVEQIESMFGLWLKSLYQIHDSLTCAADDEGSDGLDNTSDSEYESA